MQIYLDTQWQSGTHSAKRWLAFFLLSCGQQDWPILSQYLKSEFAWIIYRRRRQKGHAWMGKRREEGKLTSGESREFCWVHAPELARNLRFLWHRLQITSSSCWKGEKDCLALVFYNCFTTENTFSNKNAGWKGYMWRICPRSMRCLGGGIRSSMGHV